VGDGEKLLTHLNSALKVLLGLDIFPRVPKKKLNFVDQCYEQCVSCSVVLSTAAVPADAGFLCDKSAVISAAIKE